MDPKRKLLLLGGGAALVMIVWWIAGNWEAWGDDETGNPGLQFASVLLLGLIAGFLIVFVVLPSLGDKVGEMVYSAPEKVEPDAYSKAAAKVSQGDYQGAIAAYKAIADDEPDNRFPIVEIAKIQHDHLHDIDASIATFETAIESKDWEVNDAAFMIFRLHDLYLKDKGNETRARELLQLVIEKFPDTRHSANAHHKLNEMNAIG